MLIPTSLGIRDWLHNHNPLQTALIVLGRNEKKNKKYEFRSFSM